MKKIKTFEKFMKMNDSYFYYKDKTLYDAVHSGESVYYEYEGDQSLNKGRDPFRELIFYSGIDNNNIIYDYNQSKYQEILNEILNEDGEQYLIIGTKQEYENMQAPLKNKLNHIVSSDTMTSGVHNI